MGSTILADPAMRKAAARTGAELFFVIFAQNAESLALVGRINPANIFTIRNGSLWRLTVDTVAFLIWARRRGIDTVIDLELFSRFTGLLTGLSGADRRIGFYRFHNEGLYRRNAELSRGIQPHIHIAKNFIALVDALPNETPTAPGSKTVIGDDELALSIRPPTPIARDKIAAQIKSLVVTRDLSLYRLILVNPNASDLAGRNGHSAMRHSRAGLRSYARP